jgi:hypothetical protein
VLVLSLAGSPMANFIRRTRRYRSLGPAGAYNRHFEALRDAVWGRSRHEVIDMLGVPPAAGGGHAPGSAKIAGAPPFWTASIWYYPINPAQHTAVAIRFANDRASGVDFIPGISRSD